MSQNNTSSTISIAKLPTFNDMLDALSKAVNDNNMCLLRKSIILGLDRDFTIAPLDDCVQIVQTPADQLDRSCIQDNHTAELVDLRQYLIDYNLDPAKHDYAIEDNAELAAALQHLFNNYACYTARHGGNSMVLRSDCAPRHKSITDLPAGIKYVMSELRDVPVAVPIDYCKRAIIDTSDDPNTSDTLHIAHVPRWRTCRVHIDEDAFLDLSVIASPYAYQRVKVEVQDMCIMTLAVPDGYSQTAYTALDTITHLGATFHKHCENDRHYHESMLHELPHGRVLKSELIIHNGVEFATLRAYARHNNQTLHDVRNYHGSMVDCKIQRTRNYPQSKTSMLLSKFTIGFEVEKSNPSWLNHQYVKTPLYAAWESDASCGIEGITHPYTMNNLLGFKRDAEASEFMTNIEVSHSCGGHINVCDNCIRDDVQHNYPTNAPLKREVVRPIAGVLYAVWRNRVKNTYCNRDLRLTQTSPDRYCSIRNKRNRLVEFRISDKFKSTIDLVRAFELMQHVIKTAVVMKYATLARSLAIQSTLVNENICKAEVDFAQQELSTDRLQSCRDADYLVDYYHKHNVPAFHQNFDGHGGAPVENPLYFDWICYLLLMLKPWFKRYGFNNNDMQEIIRLSYAFNHYIQAVSNTKTLKSVNQYI